MKKLPVIGRAVRCMARGSEERDPARSGFEGILSTVFACGGYNEFAVSTFVYLIKVCTYELSCDIITYRCPIIRSLSSTIDHQTNAESKE
jgi:hypothetical protein